MEGIELSKAVEEARVLLGARVSRVHQLGDVFLFRFFSPSGALALDVSGKAFHRTEFRPPVPQSPPAFCRLLRKLSGQPLLAMDQAGYDRAVRLRFSEADLILDLRPKKGNLFLVFRDGKNASLRPGELQPLTFADPDDPTRGLGPNLRRAAAAMGYADLLAFAKWLVSQPPAGYIYEEDGIVASFFPRPDLKKPAQIFPHFWQALDQALAARLARDESRNYLEQVERAIRRRKRTLAKIAERLEQASRWEGIKAEADLILARLSEIPSGVSEAVVEGFDGNPVRIMLDPATSPLAHAQVLYRQASKLRRELSILPRRRLDLLAEIQELSELADLVRTRPELAPYLAGELERLGILAPKREEPEAPSRPRELRIGDFLVIVGRSARENDQIVRTAHAHDIWLHARGVPGAHVLIRTGGKKVPEWVLLQAAQLAAWHSQARGERKVLVSYTEVRHIKKPNRAPPGSVLLQKEEVIVVSGEEPPEWKE